MTENKLNTGDNGNDKILDLYKIYLEDLRKVTDRRQASNSFFIFMYTAILSLISVVSGGALTDGTWITALPLVLVGFISCVVHRRFLISYKNLIRIKYEQVYKLEESLPVALYTTEWKMINRTNRGHVPFSNMEKIIPLIFGLMYSLILLAIILQSLSII